MSTSCSSNLKPTITSQLQLENTYDENARQKTEIDTLRTELARTKIELEVSASGDQKLRASLQAAIDTILTLDYHSEAVVLKYRLMCNERVREGMDIVHELMELANSLPGGRQRTIVSKARDGIIALDRALLDGMDNGLHHHGTCRSFFAFPILLSMAHGYVSQPYDESRKGATLTFLIA